MKEKQNKNKNKNFDKTKIQFLSTIFIEAFNLISWSSLVDAVWLVMTTLHDNYEMLVMWLQVVINGKKIVS